MILIVHKDVFLFGIDDIKSAYFSHAMRERNNPISLIRDIQDEILCDVAFLALRHSGIESDLVAIDPSFSAYGSTSFIRALEVDAGGQAQRYAMRVQYSEPYSSHDYSEIELLVHGICKDAGITVPRIYATHYDIPENLRPPITFSIEELIQGQNGAQYAMQHPDSLDLLLQSMGTSLAAMHRLPIDGGFGHFKVDDARKGRLVGIHATYRDRIMGGLSRSLLHIAIRGCLEEDQIRDIFDYYKTAPIIDELGREDTCLLQGDSGLHNLLVDTKAAPVSRIITLDFGEAQGGSKIHDLAIASLSLYRCGLAKHSASLMDAYQAQGGKLPSHLDESLRTIRLRGALSVLGVQIKTA